MATAILEKQPGNIVARYCAGIADIMTGDIMKGLSHLWCIVYQYKNVQIGPDINTKNLIGWIAYQFVLLCEANYQQIIQRSVYCIDAAGVCKTIGTQLGNSTLTDFADSVLDRVLKDEDGKNMLLRPCSPLTLQVEPTNYCNLRCTMCPRRFMKRTAGFLDEVLWDDMLESWDPKHLKVSLDHLVHGIKIDFIAKRRIKLFFMGEPLLHPKLDRLISSAIEKGCIVIIQTNGLLLDDFNIRQKLLHAQPSAIGISLDGLDSDTYELVRAGSTWSKILNGIRLLHKERSDANLDSKVNLQIATILSEDSEYNRQRALEFLAPVKNCVDVISFIQLTRSYSPDFFDNKGELVTFTTNDGAKGDGIICVEPFDKLNVLWDGRVVPCCYDINGDMVLGHVREGIDNIWNNDKTLLLHRGLINNDITALPLCRACKV